MGERVSEVSDGQALESHMEDVRNEGRQRRDCSLDGADRMEPKPAYSVIYFFFVGREGAGTSMNYVGSSCPYLLVARAQAGLVDGDIGVILQTELVTYDLRFANR